MTGLAKYWICRVPMNRGSVLWVGTADVDDVDGCEDPRAWKKCWVFTLPREIGVIDRGIETADDVLERLQTFESSIGEECVVVRRCDRGTRLTSLEGWARKVGKARLALPHFARREPQPFQIQDLQAKTPYNRTSTSEANHIDLDRIE